MIPCCCPDSHKMWPRCSRYKTPQRDGVEVRDSVALCGEHCHWPNAGTDRVSMMIIICSIIIIKIIPPGELNNGPARPANRARRYSYSQVRLSRIRQCYCTILNVCYSRLMTSYSVSMSYDDSCRGDGVRRQSSLGDGMRAGWPL